jgi:penicillin-binding protein 1B
MEATVDMQSGQLATASCPQTQNEYFIEGSQPTQYCQLHGGQAVESTPGSWLSRLFGKGESPAPPAPGGNAAGVSSNPPGQKPGQPSNAQEEEEQPEKKKGFLGKVFGIFGGENKKPEDGSKSPQP